MENYQQRLEKATQAIHDADFLLIGAGAGLSDAAGLKYSGERFNMNFKPFIEKYGFKDLYSSSFYPFKTEEERWAYWAKHISLNRYETGATPLYKDLLKLARQKPFFVITTNVESQFQKAGFDEKKIYSVQGDYSFLQCANACHSKLYYNEELVFEMIEKTQDCKIPSALVPRCPVCGGKMDVNLRKDGNFVEDENWHSSNNRYSAFLKEAGKGKIVLLELGVGFNTPGIIRYPFEKMTYQNESATLIRLNKNHPNGAVENEKRTISFTEDMSSVINSIFELNDARHLESLAWLHEKK